jgi:hypothetical protein
VNQPQKAALEEGVAMGVLRQLHDPDPPISAFALAKALGLRVQSAPVSHARLVGGIIQLNTRVRKERQHGLVAHELGHWALRNAGEQDSEEAASYVGSALMLPRDAFSADLRATGWDLRQLRAKHVHCSAELIARRVVTLRDAVVSIWDNGRLKARLWSPWLPEGYQRISAFERQLARDVLDRGETIEAGPLLWGFAIFEGAWKRAITVCEAEQLGFRY